MNKTLSLFVLLVMMMPLNADTFSKKSLSLETARKMAEACLLLAKENKWKINIAIYDSSRALKYYAAMDNSYPASEEIAKLKGKTSAGLPLTTKDLSDRAFQGEKLGAGLITIPETMLLQGGIPIILQDGNHIGGIGVSGDSGANDEVCAEAALNTIFK
ncbi:MAG: heme-binding protein [SAR86 cluster bacterium]|nr:heme-binding protein [SAR86 cluster bacterium]